MLFHRVAAFPRLISGFAEEMLQSSCAPYESPPTFTALRSQVGLSVREDTTRNERTCCPPCLRSSPVVLSIVRRLSHTNLVDRGRTQEIGRPRSVRSSREDGAAPGSIAGCRKAAPALDRDVS